VCGVEAHSQNLEPLLERIGARDRVSVAVPDGSAAG
jgi:hypothetical protein